MALRPLSHFLDLAFSRRVAPRLDGEMRASSEIEPDNPVGDRHDGHARVGRDELALAIVREVAELRRAADAVDRLPRRGAADSGVECERDAREVRSPLSQQLEMIALELDQVVAQVLTRDDESGLRALWARVAEIACDLDDGCDELHTSRVRTGGLVAVLGSLCRDTSRHAGADIVFTHDPLPPVVSPTLSLALYEVVVEALANVVRHSRARHGQIRLAQEHGELVLQIADSGIGFECDGVYVGSGLTRMRERVAQVKGRMVIRSSPGNGTRIGFLIPLIASQ
jgi:signal transduction histidine kinase